MQGLNDLQTVPQLLRYYLCVVTVGGGGGWEGEPLEPDQWCCERSVAGVNECEALPTKD